MKKIIVIAAAGVILISCVLAGEAARGAREAQSGAAQTASENVYVVKSEDGKLVVYRKGDSKPFMTTGTLSSGLPRSDARRLENGVEIEGTADLRKALEDYCS